MHSNGSILLLVSRISQAGNRGLGSARQVANEPARWQHLTAQTVSYDASSPGVMAGAQDVVLGGLVGACEVLPCSWLAILKSNGQISMGAGTKIVALWAPH